jgi:hypothetical protein
MTAINTKAEILAALEDSNQRAENWFQAIPAKDFFTRHGEVWSQSDNVDHLVRAVKPIAKALKLPKFTLQAMFGKPEKPSMSYEELCKVYRDELARGAQASGRYVPNQESPAEDADARKQALLEQWSKANAELLAALEKWNVDDLDRYLLPHPLIGKLTIREMIFFTIYHNLRHASLEGD